MASENQRPYDFDVLIVGAGPTGLALGLQLARYGVKFQIIDKRSTFSSHSLAFAIQPSTLEQLFDLGVAEGLLTLGTKIRHVNAYIDGQPSFQIDFRTMGNTLFPHILAIEQSKLERILSGSLSQQGHNIGWNAELKNFKQFDDHVESEILQDGKKISVKTKWIVGCDGKDSTVRSILGIPIQGNKTEENFILADLALEWELKKDEGYVFLHPSDIFEVFPLPGGIYRVITTQKGLDPNKPVTIQGLVKKFQELCPVPGALTAPQWIEGYSVTRAIASQMRIRRAFLAGDSAHVHSPLGGQSLNTGIDDAVNLGWKLGMYINETVGEDYLDTYEAERRKVAQANLSHTNLATSIVMTRSKIGQFMRDLVAPLILNYPAAQKQLERIIGDNPVSYDPSESLSSDKTDKQSIATKIKEGFTGGASVGDRFRNIDLQTPKDYKRLSSLRLFQTPKHVLLCFLGDKSKEFKQQYASFSEIKKNYNNLADCYFIVGEHAIDYTSFDPNLEDAFLDPDGRAHEAYKCYEPTVFLIRPDGYICYKGPNSEAPLKEYIDSHFNMDKVNLIAEFAKQQNEEMTANA